MSGYSPDFVQLYDQLMGSYTRQRALIKQLIHKHNPEGKKLLEIACGTGNMLLPFSKTYQISGLDISKDMLAIAREKLPGASFYEGDMSAFDLQKKFDVIFCFYDSINHLLSFAKWESMFAHVSRHLEKDGIFIFDVSTIQRMVSLSEKSTIVHKKGNLISTLQVTRLNQHGFKSRFQIIHPKTPENWECIEEYVEEKCFEVARIKKTLEKYFTIEEVIDPFQDAPTVNSQILLFACRKKMI